MSEGGFGKCLVMILSQLPNLKLFSVSLPSECSAFQLYCQWELELEENVYKFLFSV